MSDQGQVDSEGSDRREQKRLELLDAAMRVFCRDGFARARIDDIAAEAGIGKGTVYLYADSKVSLFKHVVRQRVLPILIDVEEMRSGHKGTAEELLRMQVRRFFREVSNPERQKLTLLILSEGPQFPELMTFYAENVMLRAQRAIKQTLTMGMENGEFRKLPVDDLPRTILGGIMASGIWQNTLIAEEYRGRDDFCQLHLDVILNGLIVK